MKKQDKMRMQIRRKTTGPISILVLKGMFMAPMDEELFISRINALLRSGRKLIVVNLEQVPYMNSVGEWALVERCSQINQAGGKLKLCSISRRAITERVISPLVISKLHSVFEVFDTEREAIESFKM